MTPQQIQEQAEKLYREYPTEIAGSMNYNKDIHCFKKRKAFVKGAQWMQERENNQIISLKMALIEILHSSSTLQQAQEVASQELIKLKED